MKRPEKKNTYDLSFDQPEFADHIEDLEKYIDYLEGKVNNESIKDNLKQNQVPQSHSSSKSIDDKRVLATIKIGRIEYEVKDGDYILFNGACHQFCSGDGRALKYKGFDKYSSLIIPKTTVKKIPFDKLKKEKYVSKYLSGGIKWIL